jgi:F0F1-type ATP synthase membrane subunit b/b'
MAEGARRELEEGEIMKKSLAIAAACLLLGLTASAEKPVQNVSGKRHPNIAAAQNLSRKAFEKIVAAQKANEFDMAGHAQKAKDLLDQANAELKLAAEAANENKGK